MSNVEFSEDRAYATSLNRVMNVEARGLRAIPIKLGLAKDEAGADIILIGVAILSTILAVAVFFVSTRSTTSSGTLPPDAFVDVPGMPAGAFPPAIPQR